MTVHGEDAPGQLLLSMVDTLERDVEQLHPSSALAVSEGIASIIAAGLRSLPGANVRRPSNLTAYHLSRIKAHVQRHLRDPSLSISSIVAAVGLSSDHVCRLFREEPLSLSRLIWQQRLDACRRDLIDPRLATCSISDIAFSWGFNDAAHFSHTFRKHAGVSPREWRSQALQSGKRSGAQ
jgi:AraC-like DNA-binding protein